MDIDLKERLIAVARAFDLKMLKLDELRRGSVDEGVPPVTLRILGQVALLLHPEARTKLNPIATQDFDAQFEGGIEREILQADLANSGFHVDPFSQYIWIPPEAKYDRIFESRFLSIDIIQPLYNLVSKAVKAPEKNRLLVQLALKEYGFELFHLIVKHGGDPEQFK